VKTRFSVLVPVHNREECVRETIDSVLSQTFQDYELIAIDDGSSDRTSDILQSYGTRIKLIHQVNQGPEVARNLGASQAKGEYLALLDSDDLFLPCALATYDWIIKAFDSPAVIIGAMSYFSQEQVFQAEAGSAHVAEVLKYRDFLSKDVSVGMSSSRIVIRKSVFEQAGGLRASTPTTFHLDDYNLLIRAGTYGPCLVVKRPTTVAYRAHAGNAMSDMEAMVRGVLSLVCAERQGLYPGGRDRRFARFACIGGPAYYWSRNALRSGRPGLAFRLLTSGWPMVAAAALRKLCLQFRPATPSMLVRE
jgi:glycosyltransferase involved in cell wall biosynthesis